MELEGESVSRLSWGRDRSFRLNLLGRGPSALVFLSIESNRREQPSR